MNAAFRMSRAEAYTYVGNAYAALAASDDEEVAGQSRSYWHSARDMYQRSLDTHFDMGRRGISTHEDASDKVISEIAKSDAVLGTSAVQQ